MILLIADSGSTKTLWSLVETSPGQPVFVRQHTTQGLNPLYADDIAVQSAVRELFSIWPEAQRVDSLHFYGAGCSGKRIDDLKTWLQPLFVPSVTIEVASDLLGACRALYGRDGYGIACIMGTGSIAACYQAGPTEHIRIAPSLGYVLGDEGSGAYLGRQILSDYVKNQMPPSLRTDFEDDYGSITPESVIEHTYRKSFPNRYLASFAPFVGRHLSHPYCQGLAYRGIESFFVRNVRPLDPESLLPVSFVGSVAYHLRDILQQVATYYDYSLGSVLPDPMSGLIAYHTDMYQPD